MADIKTTVKDSIRAIGRMPGVFSLVHHPRVRAALFKLPGSDLLYGLNWADLRHPFDRRYGVDTGGHVPSEKLTAEESVRRHAIDYAGSQPNVIRLALAKLPALDSFSFLDLGCGKGRPLIVASEFPFRSILGVELSQPLAEIARANAARIAQQYPQRPAIRVEVGDASRFPLPSGNVVLFMYHPFGEALVANVAAGIEAALAAERRDIYVIYYNPIAGRCFDGSTQLRRRFAGMLPYANEERGFGPDLDDPVVIWQASSMPVPAERADARIISPPGCGRVVLAPA
jgi:SAM-dependent methyltransferase